MSRKELLDKKTYFCRERIFSFRYRIKKQYVTGHKIPSPTSNRVFGRDNGGLVSFTNRGRRHGKKSPL